MSEQLPDPAPPRTTYPPVDVTPEIARKNVVLGVALFGLALLIAAGAVVVSLIYLHYD
jgi:hypothetical protein